MKCRVCNKEVEQGRAKCQACGFPVLQTVNEDPEAEKKIREMAENFRKKKLQTVSISLRVYTNTMEGSDVKVVKEEDIILAEGLALAGKDILWFSEKFARQTGDCSLKVTFTNTKGEKKTCTVSVANPKIMDFWQVGLMPMDGFEFCIVVGNRKEYTSSEVISYL